MKIYELPKKANLAYLDAQYFHNDPKPGVAEHVIKIQYRTKRGEPQAFIIPVSNDLRNINRSAKNQLGADGGKLVKDRAKQLSKAKVTFMFGFRLVRYVEMTPKGGKLFKKKSDGNTQCWVTLKEDHYEVEMTWGGDILKVKIYPHQKQHDNPKSSLGIGYYDQEQDLKDNITRLKNDTLTADDEPVEQDQCTEADAAENQGRVEVEVRSSNSGSGRVCAADAIARATGNSEASCVCASDQAQVVDEEVQEQKPSKRAYDARNTRSADRVQEPARKANKRAVVDRNEWGVWEPVGVPEGTADLGTSIRF